MLIRNDKIFLLFIFCSWLVLQTLIFAQGIEFKHLTVESGLSNNKVNCVLEDKVGFIWFGTEDGLNRFDGYGIKIYRHQDNDKNSLSSNNIWSMYQDKDGYIWIGTKTGEINRYNPFLDKFDYWKIDSKGINENSVICIYQDKTGRIWIGTYKNGLYLFDVKANKFTNWHYQPDDQKSLSNNYVTSILEDQDGSLWISTYNGLNRFNPANFSNSFKRFYHDPKKNKSICNNLVWNLTPSADEKNKFWVSTLSGISLYDANDSTFTKLDLPEDKNLQFGNSIGSIIEERKGEDKVLWLASYAGLIKMERKKKDFYRFLYEEENPVSLSNNQINGLLKDRSGVIWIATENGVNFISPKEARFNYSLTKEVSKNGAEKLIGKNINSILQTSGGSIVLGTPQGLWVKNGKELTNRFNYLNNSSNINSWALCDDEPDKIWIGTYGQGLKKLDLNSNQITSIEINSPQNIPSNFKYIKSLLKDNDGNLWIGSWGSGLARYQPKTKNFKLWINDPKDLFSISYNDVWALFQDSQNNIWISTNGGGLNLFDKKSEKFIRLTSDSNNKYGLSSNSIFSIYESKFYKLNNNKNVYVLWLGTSNGLNKLTINANDLLDKNNQLKNRIKVYTVKDGLPDNSVKSIVEDENGNLWLGTSNGLSEFNPLTEQFINYSISDGLKSNDFNSGAALRTKDGTILLGGNKGLNIFDPKEIIQSQYQSPVVITDIQLFNESVPIGEDSPLSKNILFTKEITLSHDENIFSFQFASLDFNSPPSIQYAYKLEGFDKDWVNAGRRRYAAYTNLSPATYYFMVKATNSDGVWNPNYSTIKVVIAQPWWKTGWAYLLYLLIIFLSLVSIRRFEINRAKLRNELKMREFESQKLREIENMKSRFFANLSHEFRTPLMLIKGPLEQLKNGQVTGDPKNYYDMIYRNTENLHTLIDQLLELTQLEAEAIPIRARKENLITVLRGIFYSFESIANQKNIGIEFDSDDKSICAWIDRDKLSKIINNILSNSFKFTPSGGMITLTVQNISSNNEDFARIKISDTGIGIPKDKLDRIFDRFFQVDDSSGRSYGGSGIGLSLVKELVDLHKWEIKIDSDVSKGTTFILTIPLSDSYLSNKQKIIDENRCDDSAEQNAKDKNQKIERGLNNLVENGEPILDERTISDESVKKNPLILVVEDSNDVRTYISSLLKTDYNIIEAENAEEGIAKATELMPDLILSDIMMPGMDGMEFCKHIKTNFQTSHIPVILLTAKVSQESRIEGLETGADDYVTKPFNFRELSIRIKNLLEQRKRLKDKFSKEIKIQPETVTVNAVDKDFLERVLNAAEKNIYNSDFNSELLAKEMFVSRSQLHRKMIAITGQAPGEFIRVFRLKKAAQLLLEKKLNVTQIALEVGFNSPSHFTKAFQQYFNCLPSDFVVKNNNK